MNDLIESANRYINDSFYEFYIHMTLATGFTRSEIDKIFEDMLSRFLKSPYMIEWCIIDNKMTSYRCCLPVLSKFEGVDVTKLIKVFDKICPQFKLCSENWNFGTNEREVIFDIKFSNY